MRKRCNMGAQKIAFSGKQGAQIHGIDIHRLIKKAGIIVDPRKGDRQCNLYAAY
jgi:hypothetical protein